MANFFVLIALSFNFYVCFLFICIYINNLNVQKCIYQ